MRSEQLKRNIEYDKKWLAEHPEQDGVNVRISLAQNVRWLALASSAASKKSLLLESISILETVMDLIAAREDYWRNNSLAVTDKLVYQYREMAELYDSEGNQYEADAYYEKVLRIDADFRLRRIKDFIEDTFFTFERMYKRNEKRALRYIDDLVASFEDYIKELEKLCNKDEVSRGLYRDLQGTYWSMSEEYKRLSVFMKRHGYVEIAGKYENQSILLKENADGVEKLLSEHTDGYYIKRRGS